MAANYKHVLVTVACQTLKELPEDWEDPPPEWEGGCSLLQQAAHLYAVLLQQKPQQDQPRPVGDDADPTMVIAYPAGGDRWKAGIRCKVFGVMDVDECKGKNTCVELPGPDPADPQGGARTLSRGAFERLGEGLFSRWQRSIHVLQPDAEGRLRAHPMHVWLPAHGYTIDVGPSRAARGAGGKAQRCRKRKPWEETYSNEEGSAGHSSHSTDTYARQAKRQRQPAAVRRAPSHEEEAESLVASDADEDTITAAATRGASTSATCAGRGALLLRTHGLPVSRGGPARTQPPPFGTLRGVPRHVAADAGAPAPEDPQGASPYTYLGPTDGLEPALSSGSDGPQLHWSACAQGETSSPTAWHSNTAPDAQAVARRLSTPPPLPCAGPVPRAAGAGAAGSVGLSRFASEQQLGPATAVAVSAVGQGWSAGAGGSAAAVAPNALGGVRIVQTVQQPYVVRSTGPEEGQALRSPTRGARMLVQGGVAEARSAHSTPTYAAAGVTSSGTAVPSTGTFSSGQDAAGASPVCHSYPADLSGWVVGDEGPAGHDRSRAGSASPERRSVVPVGAVPQVYVPPLAPRVPQPLGARQLTERQAELLLRLEEHQLQQQLLQAQRQQLWEHQQLLQAQRRQLGEELRLRELERLVLWRPGSPAGGAYPAPAAAAGPAGWQAAPVTHAAAAAAARPGQWQLLPLCDGRNSDAMDAELAVLLGDHMA